MDDLWLLNLVVPACVVGSSASVGAAQPCSAVHQEDFCIVVFRPATYLCASIVVVTTIYRDIATDQICPWDQQTSIPIAPYLSQLALRPIPTRIRCARLYSTCSRPALLALQYFRLSSSRKHEKRGTTQNGRRNDIASQHRESSGEPLQGAMRSRPVGSTRRRVTVLYNL